MTLPHPHEGFRWRGFTHWPGVPVEQLLPRNLIIASKVSKLHTEWGFGSDRQRFYLSASNGRPPSPLNYSLWGYVNRIQQREWRSPADTPTMVQEVLS
ncbi:hypothetical protein [Argonema galeatum]|uniref:hypothetical protein n=1 Tax=Argonema galeatum TaxID=2942762 RepID=UPI00201152A0|nr:hypothetical protein [Argonema galeatum]MCL1466588.1 hypothetical protein [Argonema galeatum A003/A1]